MLEGVLANMLRQTARSMETFYMLEGVGVLLDANMLRLAARCLLDGSMTFYMLEGVLANMLRLSARWRPFTCWREC